MLSPRRLGTMVTIFPDDWSEGAQAAYDVASLAGDTSHMAAIIREQTGQQVIFDDTPVPNVIEIGRWTTDPATMHGEPGGWLCSTSQPLGKDSYTN